MLMGTILLAGCGGGPNPSLYEGLEEMEACGGIDALTPANDFYGYINAGSVMERTIPQDSSSSSVSDDLEEAVSGRMDELINEIAASDQSYEAGSNEQLIRDVYRQSHDSAMGNETGVEEDTAILDAIIQDVSSAANMADLTTVLGRLATDYGVQTIFNVKTVNDYWNADTSILQFEFKYAGDLEGIIQSDRNAVGERDNIAECLVGAGMSKEEAKDASTGLIYTLYDIAGHTDFNISNNNTRLQNSVETVTESDYADVGASTSFEQLLSVAGNQVKVDRVYFRNPEQVKRVLCLMDDEHLQIWKNYILYTLFFDHDSYFPQKYNPYAGEKLSSEEAARNNAISFVKEMLPDQVAEVYVQKYFSNTKRDDIMEICEKIRDEYYSIIDDAEWLSAEGKEYLSGKLDTMQFFIGGNEPHAIDPADALLVGNSRMQTRFNLMAQSLQAPIVPTG